MILALALAVASAQTSDAMVEGYHAGARWATEGVSARCMIEVANSPEDQEQIKTEEGRKGASMKAQILAGFWQQLVETNDRLAELVEQRAIREQDLFDNGLITQREYDEKVTGKRKNVSDIVEEVATAMHQYPACDFFRLLGDSPTVRRARALVGSPIRQ